MSTFYTNQRKDPLSQSLTNLFAKSGEISCLRIFSAAWGRLLLLVLLFCSLFPLNAADNSSPLELLNSLYTTAKGAPVEDAVIEMDFSEAADNGQLQPSSKDQLSFKKPNLLRIDSTLIDPGGTYDGKKITIIRDGTNSYMYMDEGAYPVKKSLDEPSGTNNLPYYLQVYPQDEQNRRQLAKSETVDGVNCKKIVIELAAFPGNTVTLWVDPQRRLPLQLEKHYPADGETPERTLTIAYQDIRQLPDSRYFPFKLVFSEGGKVSKVIVYKNVKINSGVKDEVFHPADKKR